MNLPRHMRIALASVLLLGVIVGGCGHNPYSAIAGRWQPIVATAPAALTFTTDGTVTLQTPATQVVGTYHFIDGGTLQIDWQGQRIAGHALIETFTVTFGPDTITLVDSDRTRVTYYRARAIERTSQAIQE